MLFHEYCLLLGRTQPVRCFFFFLRSMNNSFVHLLYRQLLYSQSLFLVSMYFKVVLHEANKDLVSDLITVLMERVLCLYKNKPFQDEVRK